MEKIKFTKMQGAGNDYVYIECLREVPENLPLLARRISDRHYGVGGDGLVAIMCGDNADFRMRMFNNDGSEAQMCGNASRCIAKYVYDRGLTDKREITLETLAGIRRLRIHTDADNRVDSVRVDMGEPVLEHSSIPVAFPKAEGGIDNKVRLEGVECEITAVGMGNPHGVVFTDNEDTAIDRGFGPQLETHEIWPEKANIEFVRVLDPHHVRVRVWERGSGETMACGTGACAVCVAGVLNGLTSRSVDVEMPGGVLHIDWDENDNHVYLSGGAEIVADGVYYPVSDHRDF